MNLIAKGSIVPAPGPESPCPFLPSRISAISLTGVISQVGQQLDSCFGSHPFAYPSAELLVGGDELKAKLFR